MRGLWLWSFACRPAFLTCPLRLRLLRVSAEAQETGMTSGD